MKTRKIVVNVTKKDIEAGKRGNCNNCPIALSLGRRVKKPYHAEVHEGFVFLSNFLGYTKTVDLPKEAAQFVHRFDDDDTRALAPFRFTLTLPVKVLKK